MNDHPNVSCVVLTWNDKKNVLACLDSMSQLTYPNLEIIVSDNGSTDGSIEAIKTQFPDVTLLENGENLFWAGGNNVGIKYAYENDADYIFLLNNDIEVHPELVSELVKVGESDPEIGILGPKIYYHNEGKKLWYAGGKIYLWRGIAEHVGIREIDEGQYDEVCETDYVTGCALMMKRQVVDDIGFIDPVYIAYGEDADFCQRATLAGYKIKFVPDAILWHKIGAYWGIVSKRKIQQKLRSNLIFFWRYSPKLAWITTIPLFFIWDALRVVFLIITGKIRGKKND